jgi:hypothetical protein
VFTLFQIQAPVDESFWVAGLPIGTRPVVVNGSEVSVVAIMSVATLDLQIESRATIQFIYAWGRRKAEISRHLFPARVGHSPLSCANH